MKTLISAALWPASKRLHRRPVALRAIFNAHGPIQTVSRTGPREWMAKIGVMHYSRRQLLANAAIKVFNSI
jgi:hypothetical protein